MQIVFTIAFMLIVKSCSCQDKDSIDKNAVTIDSSAQRTEILNSGFFDILNNGQVNTSVRFIRIFVGEPGKFAIPLSIYSGVSSNNFQNQQSIIGFRSNTHLANDFINPLSGLVNISADGVFLFKRNEKRTGTGLLTQSGIRILTAYRTGEPGDPETGQPVNFLNAFSSQGIYFKTGAWEKNNLNNLGTFWFAFRYIGAYSGIKQLRTFIPDIQSNGFYHGWSLAWGIEITKLVNIRVIYYKYLQPPEPEYSVPVYHFSFNYTVK